MSRAFDFVLVGVVTIISIVIHRVAIELFAPGTPLYKVATDGTEVMNGQATADFWFQALAIYMPLMAVGGILAYAMIREYRRQAVTAASPMP